MLIDYGKEDICAENYEKEFGIVLCNRITENIVDGMIPSQETDTHSEVMKKVGLTVSVQVS
jgi:hypothetical protein